MLFFGNKKIRIKKTAEKFPFLPFLVGVAGFEPTTPCSQSRCANRTALHPVHFFKCRAKIRLFLIPARYALHLSEKFHFTLLV